MPRLEPSDIGTGRLCRNVASRTQGGRLAASGSGTGFRPGREFGEQLASARRRCALVAAMAEETGRAGRRGRRSGFLAEIDLPDWRVTMDCTKQRKLVQSLLNLTRVASIDWKPSLQANVFQVSFQENTVRIGLKEGRRQEEGGIMIQLVNGDGVVVESFTNVDLQAKHTCINPQPWFPIMMDLFDEARRSALGADKEIHERVIDEILFDLDSLTLPPRPAAIEKRLPPTRTEGPPLESRMHALSVNSLPPPDREKEYGDTPVYSGVRRYAGQHRIVTSGEHVGDGPKMINSGVSP